MLFKGPQEFSSIFCLRINRFKRRHAFHRFKYFAACSRCLCPTSLQACGT
jgi:hypothetical protein